MDDALAIIKPDPDSHFLLLPCEGCESDNVAYVKYQHPAGEAWRVKCFDCEKVIDPGRPMPRHDVQQLWNSGGFNNGKANNRQLDPRRAAR